MLYEVHDPMPRFDLLLISGLILFLELACIRWLPAHVLFLSFFTNTVLLACFLGMSIGCLTATKSKRELLTTPYWLLLTLMLGLLVQVFRGQFERHTDVGNQARPEVVFFGTEVSAVHGVRFAVPVEVIAGVFFFLTAAMMVGLGQELGRSLNRIPNRIVAYSLDLLGSLCGIALFAACSYFQLPPVVWFGIAALGIAYFVIACVTKATAPQSKPLLPLLTLLAAVAVTVPTSGFWQMGKDRTQTFWSPYYRVDYGSANRFINTNLIGHQVMHAQGSPTHALYDQPYLFQQSIGRAPFRRILVIGAGSGNDIARAVYWCPPDAKIDAVEIDPVIQRIGAADHPAQPYRDPRVTVHLNDGRNFLRRAPDAEYDLVIFALVDSLVLHSGYSNIRLESYLFTAESFQDVARVLKPDGITAVYNFFRQGWIVARIRDEMKAAFHTDPLVLTVNTIDVDASESVVPLDGALRTIGGFTAIFAGREAGIEPLKAMFARSGNTYWLPGKVGVTKEITGGFQANPPPAPPPPVNLSPADQAAAALMPGGRPDWVPLRPATVPDSPHDLVPASDDWPFLYVRRPSVPDLTIRGVILTLILSAVLWFVFRERRKPDVIKPEVPEAENDTGLLIRAFLLGAGFMLIETRAVVQMALLFGSTWVVNTVVFAAILVMALCGNLYAGWVKPRRLEPYYVGLFATLAANLFVPTDAFLGMDRGMQMLAACGLAFAPVVFAGVVFPVSFGRTKRPDRFFGANVAGALAGGFAENLSMLLGFRLLLLVAVGLYALSGLFGGRSSGTSSSGSRV